MKINVKKKGKVWEVRSGYSRKVMLIWKWAIKFAFNRNGVRCNMGEAYYSKTCPNAPLAHVKLILFNGWVIVMPRCKTLACDEHQRKNSETLMMIALTKEGLTAEVLPQNYGVLKGKLVLFDYCQ